MEEDKYGPSEIRATLESAIQYINSSVEPIADAATNLVNVILIREGNKLVAANNALADLAALRPISEADEDEPDDADARGDWEMKVIRDRDQLIAFAKVVLPLYAAIAEHSHNITIGLSAIVKQHDSQHQCPSDILSFCDQI